MAKRNNILPDAAEKLLAEPGYAPDGASIYSHAARKGRAPINNRFRDRPSKIVRERQEWSRLDVLIKHEAYEVERLERRAAEARGTD
jgi:hypothetical protein